MRGDAGRSFNANDDFHRSRLDDCYDSFYAVYCLSHSLLSKVAFAMQHCQSAVVFVMEGEEAEIEEAREGKGN